MLDIHDVSYPIAFSLDGLPIYFGTGGDDYYGKGRYSSLNHLPGKSSENLGLCNDYQNENGSWMYFTTKEYPYVLGCHRASFDSETQINVNFRERPQGMAIPYGTEAGEGIETLINSFQIAEDMYSMVMKFEAHDNSGIREVIVTREEENCWNFEFKENENNSDSSKDTYCR